MKLTCRQVFCSRQIAITRFDVLCSRASKQAGPAAADTQQAVAASQDGEAAALFQRLQGGEARTRLLESQAREAVQDGVASDLFERLLTPLTQAQKAAREKRSQATFDGILRFAGQAAPSAQTSRRKLTFEEKQIGSPNSQQAQEVQMADEAQQSQQGSVLLQQAQGPQQAQKALVLFARFVVAWCWGC